MGTASGTQTMRTTLYLYRNASGAIDLAMLIGAEPQNGRATIAFIPVAIVLDVPSVGIRSLRSLAESAATSTLVTSVSNALGIGIETTVIVDDATLNAMFAESPSFRAEFTDNVRIDGSILARAGSSELTAATAVRILTGSDTSGTLGHFANVQSVLTGWFSALRLDDARAARVARVNGAPALAGLAGFGDQLTFETVPVSNAGSGRVERFELRATDLASFAMQHFGPALLNGGSARSRVEILNGVGTEGLAQLVADVIVPAGGAVVLTGNSVRFGQMTTEVVYYRDRDAPTARNFARILGVGIVARGAVSAAVVDITIVIGRDFANKRKR